MAPQRYKIIANNGFNIVIFFTAPTPQWAAAPEARRAKVSPKPPQRGKARIEACKNAAAADRRLGDLRKKRIFGLRNSSASGVAPPGVAPGGQSGKSYPFMKRLIPLLCLLLTGPCVWAQDFEKNLLGVRTGLEVAYIRARGEYVRGTTDPRLGFRFAVSDQVLLWRGLPLYIESGVDFSSRGGRYEGCSFRPMYLQVPLLLTWRFGIGKQSCIRPFGGLCYGVGIGGKARTADAWSDLFGAAGFLRRSDLGIRLGVEVSIRRICIQAGFDAGLCNLFAGNGSQTPLLPAGISDLRSRSVSVGIGYDF